jgi:hypothetical protein
MYIMSIKKIILLTESIETDLSPSTKHNTLADTELNPFVIALPFTLRCLTVLIVTGWVKSNSGSSPAVSNSVLIISGDTRVMS